MTTTQNIVSREDFEAARVALLAEEKALTRAKDALAAKRRAMPAVRVDKDYKFSTAAGEVGLVDLFDGRRQLIVYHFMYGPGATVGCSGCSFLIDNLGHLAHLYARDTSFVVTSRASLSDTAAFRARMGWTDVPWVSCSDEFAVDLGAHTPDGDRPTISVYLRDGDEVLHTYTTQDRGAEVFLGTYNWLDLTALGRQEEGLDYPQQWWRFHDEFAN
ncbi:MAG TPA: DUF899 domain-containing protein [Sporichthyaceae bacterium]|jgi:predicted dithiol-disulfide oxidoreductase (DUF899 family)|nr:DUF899 domain-containing protein [Sporichthyaceae bacterium]